VLKLLRVKKRCKFKGFACIFSALIQYRVYDPDFDAWVVHNPMNTGIQLEGTPPCLTSSPCHGPFYADWALYSGPIEPMKREVDDCPFVSNDDTLYSGPEESRPQSPMIEPCSDLSFLVSSDDEKPKECESQPQDLFSPRSGPGFYDDVLE
jgi:hypothetical protein